MEKEELIKIASLEKVAKDDELVKLLNDAIAEGTLLSRCPGKVALCDRLCWEIWPDLRGKFGECCCHKPDRLEIANAIIALNELYHGQKTYKIGDIFEWPGANKGLVILTRTRAGYTLSFLKKDLIFSQLSVQSLQQATLENLAGKIEAKYLKHIGNISDTYTKKEEVIC